MAKSVPQRRCLGCGSIRNKREMIRIVCLPGGGVEIDPTWRKAGRGAYLCVSHECWRKGLKGGKGLERALRLKPSPEELERLRHFAATLVGGS